MPVALNNIPVRYRINGGAWVQETINSIQAKDTITYSFISMPVLPLSGKAVVEAQALMPDDNIPANNGKTADILLQPVVTTFPYYEDFENGPAGFVANGINSTWEFGKPSSLRINTAASGQNAWKTRLTGDYKNQEYSYLYTPCFNISGLSNPMLGFQMAYSIEDCRNFNIVCDAGWMEYSLDGTSWQKLGKFGEGENWYDYEAGQVWMRANETNWREVIIPLPVHNGTIRLRYVLQTDEGSTREGIAIDNFHVYNGGALPLNWLWFVASKTTGNDVMLKWKVFNRSIGDKFSIQFSRQDNLNAIWETIGTIPSVSGDGGQYVFTDNSTKKSGLIFYRIAWEKATGEIYYSPVRSVLFENATEPILLYPNPTDKWLQVQASMGNNNLCTVRIYGADGKLYYADKFTPINGMVVAPIHVAKLRTASGIFFVEVTNGKERRVGKWIRP
jgi:hypothetical protein